jgi:hypothetical protein
MARTTLRNQSGLTLVVEGDPREYGTTEQTLYNADGEEICSWRQDWTEEDDDGEAMDWSEYAPWTEDFLSDVDDAGCMDIPDWVGPLTDFELVETDCRKD